MLQLHPSEMAFFAPCHLIIFLNREIAMLFTSAPRKRRVQAHSQSNGISLVLVHKLVPDWQAAVQITVTD